MALVLAAGVCAGMGSDADPSERLRQGVALARQGRLDDAVASLRAHVAAFPDDVEGHMQLGRVLLLIQKQLKQPPVEAIRELEAALRLDPTRSVVKLQLAQIYGTRVPQVFNPDRMVSLYDDLVKVFPERHELRLEFARTILNSEVRLARTGIPGRPLQDSGWAMDLARFQLEKAIDLAPRDSDASIEARTLLGEVLLRSGEWDASRATFEELIRSYPDRGLDLAPAWETIGHTQMRTGDFRGAAAALRKAQELKPSPQRQFALMQAWDELGGYPRDFPEALRFPLRPEPVDPNHPPALKFTDIAARLGIDKLAGAGPVGWADYDGDGRFDLVSCGCDNFCSLFRATTTGFVDATREAKLGKLEPGFGSAWGDYDNDGDPDLYIARNGWNGPARNGLYRNEGDGTFTDVAEAAGVSDMGSSFHTAWFDYDRDGWLDLVVSNGVYVDGSTNHLYHNKGDGTFEDVTQRAGVWVAPRYGTIGVALGDYDADGWPDIFFHGRMEKNRLFHNNGDGTFTDVAGAAGVAGQGTQNGFIAIPADLDSDGDLDIFTGSLAVYDQVLAGYRPGYHDGPTGDIPRFYRNDGTGRFTDVSLEAGLGYPLGIMAGGIADLDNDGYLDIYLGTGNPEMRRLEPNIFYHNVRGRRFEDLTRFTGLGATAKGHGITFLDWDGDGDLDIFASLGGFFHGDWARSAFFLNEAGNRNHWLSVRLSQPKLNRDTIGGRVTVTAGSLRQVQEVSAGHGFGSTDPPVLHFGLGGATRVERLEIRWPDGQRQVFEDLPADQALRVEKGGQPVKAPASRP
jgi:tetratricopeptide (TPR) repeat protein